MYKLIAETERIKDVLEHARINLPTGMFEDTQAMKRAIELGLVETYYRDPLVGLGLSYVRLTEAGSTILNGES